MNSYDEDALGKFRASGKILRDTREEMKLFVKEGMPVIDICEKAEELIRKKGGKPAFPCNVSINDVAAHYTSPPGDKSVVPEESLVKVDIGAHVDGYVTDTAVTVCFNREYEDMVSAAEQALKKATEYVHADLSASSLGGVIEKTIKSHGFRPISNLCGHGVGRYLVHSGTSLPNVSQISLTKLKLGGVYAIEPFVTAPDAAGKVEDGEEVTIYRFVKVKSLKDEYAKKMLAYIQENIRTLPFAERWLVGMVPEEHHKEAFEELLKSKSLTYYPIFVEVSRKVVAQAEHTVLVTKDGCEVLT
jgi:methionyl aminopeptidase